MEVLLPDARHLPDVVLDALRLRALHARELGFLESDIAAILGVSRETVSRWWSAYVSGGLDSIPGDRTGRPSGSGRLLSEEQEQVVRDAIDHHTPEDLGIASPLWTRRAVRELIEKRFGTRLAERTVGEYLARWGYTPQRPGRRNRDQDPEEVREWLENTYPALRRRATREKAEIHWCDEMGIGADDYQGRGYSLAGHTPEIKVSGGRFRVNMISTVTNEGKARFMTYAGAMDAAVFIRFLDRLIRGAEQKIYLVADRLRVHESAAVREWVGLHKDRIEIIPHPRRAPELNPDEYLNHDAKAGVNARRLPATRNELRQQLRRFMQRIARLPDHVRSYFRHPCVQYAAAPAGM